MKKLLFTSILFLFATSLTFGQVDKAYHKTLHKMFEASGAEKTYEVVILQMFTMYKEIYTTVPEDLWDDLEKEFRKTSFKELVDLLAPVYYKHLTLKDLESLIEFYESPVGQKLVEKTPLITQESMVIGQEWGKIIGEDFEKKMKARGY
jgi:hypothetical protein